MFPTGGNIGLAVARGGDWGCKWGGGLIKKYTSGSGWPFSDAFLPLFARYCNSNNKTRHRQLLAMSTSLPHLRLHSKHMLPAEIEKIARGDRQSRLRPAGFPRVPIVKVPGSHRVLLQWGGGASIGGGEGGLGPPPSSLTFNILPTPMGSNHHPNHLGAGVGGRTP